MAAVASTPFRNLILAALPSRELKRFSAQFEFVQLPRRMQLELPNRKIEKVYFPESGIVSIVANGRHGAETEVGIIGREGTTGLAVINKTDQSPYSSYMQVSGTGHVVSANVVRDVMMRNAECHRVFSNFAQAFTLQIAESAVSSARANLEDRLARWLLMAQDRIGSESIPLTHEFLSLMMAARRPGVTEAIHALAQKGLLTHARGNIVVLDRRGLEQRAGRYYGVPENEYRRMFGKWL